MTAISDRAWARALDRLLPILSIALAVTTKHGWLMVTFSVLAFLQLWNNELKDDRRLRRTTTADPAAMKGTA